MENKEQYIEELENQIGYYADVIHTLKEVLNQLIGHPDTIANPYRLQVQHYVSYLRILRYMEENELKTIGTQTIMGNILRGRSEREIETLLLNLRKMDLVDLKLVNKRVSATLRGTCLFWEAFKKKQRS